MIVVPKALIFKKHFDLLLAQSELSQRPPKVKIGNSSVKITHQGAEKNLMNARFLQN